MRELHKLGNVFLALLAEKKGGRRQRGKDAQEEGAFLIPGNTRLSFPATATLDSVKVTALRASGTLPEEEVFGGAPMPTLVGDEARAHQPKSVEGERELRLQEAILEVHNVVRAAVSPQELSTPGGDSTWTRVGDEDRGVTSTSLGFLGGASRSGGRTRGFALHRGRTTDANGRSNDQRPWVSLDAGGPDVAAPQHATFAGKAKVAVEGQEQERRELAMAASGKIAGDATGNDPGEWAPAEVGAGLFPGGDGHGGVGEARTAQAGELGPLLLNGSKEVACLLLPNTTPAGHEDLNPFCSGNTNLVLRGGEDLGAFSPG